MIAMQAGTCGQFLLRDPKVPAQRSYTSTNNPQQLIGHGAIVAACTRSGPHTIVFMYMAAVALSSERIECPLCAGSGTTTGRGFAGGQGRHVCPMCRGGGSASRGQFRQVQQLCDQVQRVADLMQIGDADGAAGASRVAFRMARSMIESGD